MVHNEAHGLQCLGLGLCGESGNDITVDGNPQVQTIVDDSADIGLGDAFLHEIHDSLIERFQTKDNFQTASIPHEREKITRQMLFEPHLSCPLNTQVSLTYLLAESLGGGQRETFIGKKEVWGFILIRQ